jgi:endonuclease III
MNEIAIREKLVKFGKRLLHSRKRRHEYTGDDAADRLLNDLRKYPHAFVLACTMNRMIKAERAWAIPYKISEKIGGFSMSTLARLSEHQLAKLLSGTGVRFTKEMPGVFHSAVQRINRQYEGNASQIWKGTPSSAEVVYRFLEFDGVGPKIATMAVNLLARNHKIQFADYYSVDISVDRQVRRVFHHLGLCEPKATDDQIIYKARIIYPKFPGIIDWPCWEIGRQWCCFRTPKCRQCYMNDICPSAKV